MGNAAQCISITLPHHSYDIHLGSGELGRLVEHVAAVSDGRRVFMISDETVAGLYGAQVQAQLTSAGYTVTLLTVPAGEASKSLAQYERLAQAVLDGRPERQDVVMCLGGGVVGDLGGFVAATVLRGLPLIQVPTTLLAQVDSSVGGKTGVNTAHGKNLLGCFYQPTRVVMDLDTLASLPDLQRRAGYGEILKAALLSGEDFFSWLEEYGAAVLAGEPAALSHAIATSVELKAEVVRADEKESGRRACLNLGHTFAHALEAVAGYDPALPHGLAVVCGLELAVRLSVKLGLCPPELAARLEAHVAQLGLVPLLPAAVADVDALLAVMQHDKKARAGQVRFVLLADVGQVRLGEIVETAVVHDIMAQWLTEKLSV